VSGVRRPVVVGLSPGAGSSTLAAALHATDGGRLCPGTAREADIVLCRADRPTLRRAVTLACAPVGPQPVLVLAAAPDGSSAPRPVRVGRFATLVALPSVRRWIGIPSARREAAAALAVPPEDLPPDVVGYAAALRRLVDVLTGSGLLDRSTPPTISRPTTGGLLWRGLQPHSLPVAAAPTRLGSRPEPDDDALEAPPLSPAPVPAVPAG
jgi:hypothetical protein